MFDHLKHVSQRFWIYGSLAIFAVLAWLLTPSPDAIPKLNKSAVNSAEKGSKEQSSLLPSQLEKVVLQAALRDPFAAYAPPVKPSKKTIVPVFVSPPPAPTAPPLNLTFAGQMTAPDGSHVIYARWGDTVLTLVIGQTLPNGYTVTAITPHVVEFNYAPLNTRTQLDLPEPPRYEIR